MNDRLKTSKITKAFSKGLNLLKNEEERLMSMLALHENQDKTISGDKYRPKQIAITQTLSEQRFVSPKSIKSKKIRAASSTNLESIKLSALN